MFADFGNYKLYFFDAFEIMEYNKFRHNFVTILSELKKSCVREGRKCVARDEFSIIF